jgi:hypothetical protein
MVKLVFALAFLLTLTVAERASAAPSFCFIGDDGVPICFDDVYFDGPA